MKLRLTGARVRELYRSRPELSLSRLVERQLRRELGMSERTRNADVAVEIRIPREVLEELYRQHPRAKLQQIFRNHILAALKIAVDQELPWPTTD